MNSLDFTTAGQSWQCPNDPACPQRVQGACRRCRDHLRRMRQVEAWNADHAHQVLAGQARAQEFTSEYQQQAGHASFAAFSARWRAEQGLGPLDAEAVRRYVTPDMIRHLSRPVPPPLQQRIYRAWCAGYLYGVGRWFANPAWAAALDAQLDVAEFGFLQSPLLEADEDAGNELDEGEVNGARR